MLMIVTLEIPDDIAAGWPQGSDGMARTVLEDFAVEAYRQGRLTAFQLRQLLGHGSRWETRDFLASHDALPGLTLEEVLKDAAVAAAIRVRQS